QIKVPDLSLAAVWDGPAVDTDSTAWRDNPAVAQLVAAVAPRRVPVETANTLIADFAKQAGAQKQPELLLVLSGLFNVLDQERGSVMAGLDRFGARQKELAAQIRGENQKLQSMQTDPDADAKAVQALTKQVQWDVQVFQDRQQALSYVCDVPGTIEQRLFTLARTIKTHLQ
ncbi:MAG: hypothetical protein B7Z80_21485, partial [Rhodospirillales bacterium 20-64-7]